MGAPGDPGTPPGGVGGGAFPPGGGNPPFLGGNGGAFGGPLGGGPPAHCFAVGLGGGNAMPVSCQTRSSASNQGRKTLAISWIRYSTLIKALNAAATFIGSVICLVCPSSFASIGF